MPVKCTFKLSNRERQCLQCASEGYVSVEIARELGVSARTVDSHIANAMRKLRANTRVEAVAAAFRLGVLE